MRGSGFAALESDCGPVRARSPNSAHTDGQVVKICVPHIPSKRFPWCGEGGTEGYPHAGCAQGCSPLSPSTLVWRLRASPCAEIRAPELLVRENSGEAKS